MPDTIADYITQGAGIGTDWASLAAEREAYAARHENFRLEMDVALLAAHVRLIDVDSYDELGPDEPPPCPHCDGRGWFWATDLHRPWRDVKEECWECQ